MQLLLVEPVDRFFKLVCHLQNVDAGFGARTESDTVVAILQNDGFLLGKAFVNLGDISHGDALLPG